MKDKRLNENYTSVCWYCGVIFKNNKHSGHFCLDSNHRQRHWNKGSKINPLINDQNGHLINADHLLNTIYNSRREKNKDGWSEACPRSVLRDNFHYTGPLPEGEELLVVASFVIRRSPGWAALSCFKAHFTVKPIQLLTPEERASRSFVSAKEALERAKVKRLEEEETEFARELAKRLAEIGPLRLLVPGRKEKNAG